LALANWIVNSRLHRSTTIVRETRELEHVNDAIGEVLAGTVSARLVFDLR